MLAADYYTPAHAAIEAEERAELLAREEWLAVLDATWSTRQQAFKRLCAHFFSAGPNPEEVLQRVFAAAADRRPDLLRGLSKRDVELAREESPAGRRWRVLALFDGRAADWRRQYSELTATIAAAFNDAHRPALRRLTLQDALCIDGLEPLEASETLSRVLERLFCAGSSPRCVAQQCFALTGWLFRDLQFNMSLEALGRLFAEKRATQSARSKVYVEGFLREAGFRGVKAGWQKPEAACRKYAAGARGNQNRRKGRRVPVLPRPTNHKNTIAENAAFAPLPAAA